jgi:hypothetical protein
LKFNGVDGPEALKERLISMEKALATLPECSAPPAHPRPRISLSDSMVQDDYDDLKVGLAYEREMFERLQASIRQILGNDVVILKEDLLSEDAERRGRAYCLLLKAVHKNLSNCVSAEVNFTFQPAVGHDGSSSLLFSTAAPSSTPAAAGDLSSLALRTVTPEDVYGACTPRQWRSLPSGAFTKMLQKASRQHAMAVLVAYSQDAELPLVDRLKMFTILEEFQALVAHLGLPGPPTSKRSASIAALTASVAAHARAHPAIAKWNMEDVGRDLHPLLEKAILVRATELHEAMEKLHDEIDAKQRKHEELTNEEKETFAAEWEAHQQEQKGARAHALADRFRQGRFLRNRELDDLRTAWRALQADQAAVLRVSIETFGILQATDSQSTLNAFGAVQKIADRVLHLAGWESDVEVSKAGCNLLSRYRDMTEFLGRVSAHLDPASEQANQVTLSELVQRVAAEQSQLGGPSFQPVRDRLKDASVSAAPASAASSSRPAKAHDQEELVRSESDPYDVSLQQNVDAAKKAADLSLDQRAPGLAQMHRVMEASNLLSPPTDRDQQVVPDSAEHEALKAKLRREREKIRWWLEEEKKRKKEEWTSFLADCSASVRTTLKAIDDPWRVARKLVRIAKVCLGPEYSAAEVDLATLCLTVARRLCRYVRTSFKHTPDGYGAAGMVSTCQRLLIGAGLRLDALSQNVVDRARANHQLRLEIESRGDIDAERRTYSDWQHVHLYSRLNELLRLYTFWYINRPGLKKLTQPRFSSEDRSKFGDALERLAADDPSWTDVFLLLHSFVGQLRLCDRYLAQDPSSPHDLAVVLSRSGFCCIHSRDLVEGQEMDIWVHPARILIRIKTYLHVVPAEKRKKLEVTVEFCKELPVTFDFSTSSPTAMLVKRQTKHPHQSPFLVHDRDNMLLKLSPTVMMLVPPSTYFDDNRSHLELENEATRSKGYRESSSWAAARENKKGEPHRLSEPADKRMDSAHLLVVREPLRHSSCPWHPPASSHAQLSFTPVFTSSSFAPTSSLEHDVGNGSTSSSSSPSSSSSSSTSVGHGFTRSLQAFWPEGLVTQHPKKDTWVDLQQMAFMVRWMGQERPWCIRCDQGAPVVPADFVQAPASSSSLAAPFKPRGKNFRKRH